MPARSPVTRLRVVWLATAAMERTARGLTSRHASMRYRMAVPSAALQRLGCESSICHAAPDSDHRRLLGQLKSADVVVIGKVWYPPETLPQLGPRLLALIEKLRSSGTRVVADFCDDNFLHQQKGTFDIGLANSVDAVVTSTPGLAELLRSLTHAPVTTVTDPVEGERGVPRVPGATAGRAPLSLLWFGHFLNFNTLIAGLRELEPAAGEWPFSLVAVTSPGPNKESALAELDGAWRSAGRSCRFQPWSVQAVFEALQQCDAVIIPSDPQDPAKLVKSPNRFTESVWAGRFVLAHPLPAYTQLAEFGWVGEDLKAGLRWLMQHPEQALERIRAGQELVSRDYSPEAVGLAWKRAIEAA